MTLRDDLNAKKMRDRIRAWKRLPESADADPSLADMLARGLTDSHVQIRLAAARAVPAFARHSLHLVPLLIRRRFEPDARVRHAAAVGLAWVLPYVVEEPNPPTPFPPREGGADPKPLPAAGRGWGRGFGNRVPPQ
jgi:hypothetical protein